MSNLFGHKKIPSSPGVYFFRGPKNKALYIGKASNLKNRLSSYKKALDPRIVKMLEKATNLDWQETGSEVEALILESQLIKKYRPPFNIMLRDDKQYFFVGITKEEFPRIFLTHQPVKSAGKSAIHPLENSRAISRGSRVGGMADLPKADFIGPFTEGSSLKTTLKLLRRIFPYCTCKQKHNRYCLNYHIGNCLGFCCLKEPQFTAEQKTVYQKNIHAIKNILNGKKTSVFKDLEKEMNQTAQKHDFDKAIELRNKLAQLQRVFENAKVIKELASRSKVLEELQKVLNLPTAPLRIEGYDVSNIQGQFATGSMIVFVNGYPDKNEYRKFKIKSSTSHHDRTHQSNGGDTGMLREMLTRRFNHPEWQFPDLILIDGGKGQLSTALSVIPKDIAIIALTKDDKHKGSHIFSGNQKTAVPLFDLPLNVKNLILQIDDEAHRFAISYYRKLHRKTI